MLSIQNLSIEEVWHYKGALQQWNNIYVTAIIPTTVVLIVLGTTTILIQQLFSHFTQKDIFNELEKNMKEGCDITLDQSLRNIKAQKNFAKTTPNQSPYPISLLQTIVKNSFSRYN